MPKENVSYKLLHHIWKEESKQFKDRWYKQVIDLLDPIGEVGLADENLSYEELRSLFYEYAETRKQE